MTMSVVELAKESAARFHAFSASPEEQAWSELVDWADPRGLLAENSDARIYGFNNPSPSEASSNYGYEFWIASAGVSAEDPGGAEVLDFPGGKYLRTEFSGGDPLRLPGAWKDFVEQAEQSEYRFGTHQCLEGISLKGMPTHLYLPLA